MTTSLHSRVPAGEVPEWDLADKMTKSLRHSGLGVSEIAVEMGVTRDTIGRWINGRGVPGRGSLMAWATLTGVSFEWLEESRRTLCFAGSRPALRLVDGPAVKAPLTLDRRAGRHLRSVS